MNKPTSPYLLNLLGNSTITKAEVLAAQQGWGNGIVEIGKADNAKKAAMKHLKTFSQMCIGRMKISSLQLIQHLPWEITSSLKRMAKQLKSNIPLLILKIPMTT